MNNKSTTLFILILLLSFGLYAQESKQVLLISSYNSRFPTFFQQMNGIKSVLDTANTDVDIEFMDSKRFINLEKQVLFYETLKNKLAHSERYDAIITADDNAFNFALEYEDDLFKNIPIVFFGVNNIDKALEQNHNPHVSGVIEAVSMKETIELMVNFFPETKSVYCITDGTNSGKSDLKLYRQITTQISGIDFKEINLSNLTFLEYKEKLKAVPASAPVLLISAYRDKMDHTVNFDNTIKILKQNLDAPLFHLYEHGMGEGVLGGKLISHYEQGEKAATMAYRILSGESISSMEVLDKSPNIFQFDYNQLEKHKVALNTLPHGSIIINQPVTFLQKYKRIIIVVLSVICILVVLIFVLSINILKRKKIEIQLKNQNSDFSKLNSELLIAKEKAEEGEQRFKQLFYEHSAVKLLIDAETGQIFDANIAASAYYGWSIGQLTKMNINEINTLSSSEIEKEMSNARKKGNVHFEFKHRKADGNVENVEVFTSYVTISGKQYLFSIIHDVSEKKKQEHKIKLLSRSVEQSPVTIVITDKQGIIEYVNPAFTKISGYSLEEIIGKNPRILKSGNTPDKVYNELWETILSGKTWTREIQNKKVSGELYWENIVISPIYNNNELTNFVAVSEDITEKKKTIEDLIVAKDEAEESSKLKNEFLQNMSHEIRTPMNGILGFSSFLNNENLSTEKRKHYINIVQNSGNQLLRIIDDILEISKLGTKQVKINKKEICLNNLLLEQFSIFDIKAKENKTPLYFKKGLSDIESTILTDETKLNKILSNLLENALKYTNEGFIEFGYQLKNKELQIFIKDTGIGIKPEMQEKIFDRFSQEEKELSKNVGGLGLGLSIAKENAELLGGKITLQSEKGKGTTFFVTIPYKPVNPNTEKPNSDNDKSKIITKQDKYTILIVEDEEVNYLYLDTLLEYFELNYKTLHAKHGKEAVEMCKENAEIDFVLMDLKMSIMNGFEATKRIKELRPDLAIVAQTAYTTNEDKEKAFSAGCNDFISKPISKETFNEIINKYLINR